MSEENVRTSQPTPGTRAAAAPASPFLGLIDAVIVPDGAIHDFPGAVSNAHAKVAWQWMQRDLAPDQLGPLMASGDDESRRAALDALLPELLAKARAQTSAADSDPEAKRKLRARLGSDEAGDRLPIVLNALKCRNLLTKADEFGRATNALTDDAGLSLALQSMPLSDPAVSSLLFQAAVARVSNPTRLVVAAVRIAGASSEAAIQRAGLTPLVDAILSHAQAQLPAIEQTGVFADVDLICRAIDRYHRLMRAVTGYVELTRLSRWSTVVSGLTKDVSEALEPRLREVVPAISRAMRRRESVDSQELLSALNGCYVLAAVRDARDSLALNALFDQTWAQLGEALDTYIQRNLDVIRQNPADRAAAARLEATIKMAELRFNNDYAATMRRARSSAEKRAG